MAAKQGPQWRAGGQETSAGSDTSFTTVQQPPDAAGELAGRGWYVFPLRPLDKRPAVDRWEQRACADPERVTRYWPSARHNVGIACGPSGLVVADLDPPDGIEQFGRICRDSGYPGTFTVRTPRGGLHLYFTAVAGRTVRNSAGKVAPHVDIRGVGGYTVGPGSVVDGKVYAVTDGRNPAPLPKWLADLADPPKPCPRSSSDTPPAHADRYGEAALWGETQRLLFAPQGQRNHTLNVAAFALGQLVGAGILDRAEVITTLIRAADEVGLIADDGLRQCERTIDSGLTAGMAQPRARVVM
jgi:Bifunctional DNA primase/polymerase, N-terminal